MKPPKTQKTNQTQLFFSRLEQILKLKEALESAQATSGVRGKQAFVDRGYR